MVIARIAGIGGYAPDIVVTNDDLSKIVNTSDEWITTRSGIKERRFCREDQACSDLAYEAGLQALEMASVDPNEIDCIVMGTVTGDHSFPSTGCIVQEKLGAKEAIAFDVSAGCSGFILGLSVGANMIKSGQFETVLVIGGEALSKFADFQDRGTCVLFGDGAGAVVLKPGDGSGHGILSTHMKSDGSYADMLVLPAGGSRNPASHETVEKRMQYINMEGQITFKMAIRTMTAIGNEALEHNNLTIADIDYVVPHQANWRIIEGLAKKLGADINKVISKIEKYGNTSAASIPLALNEAVRSGQVKEGDLLLLTAFGDGYTWSSSVVRW